MSQYQSWLSNELGPEPRHLAFYLLVFMLGLTVASSPTLRLHWTRLVAYGGKSQKEIEKMKVAKLVASKDSSEPELLDKYAHRSLYLWHAADTFG